MSDLKDLYDWLEKRQEVEYGSPMWVFRMILREYYKETGVDVLNKRIEEYEDNK